MSPELKTLLVDIRQHAAFPELRKLAGEFAPRLKRYRPSQPDGLETIGARTAFYSGAQHQHEIWLSLLTGEAPVTQDRSTGEDN